MKIEVYKLREIYYIGIKYRPYKEYDQIRYYKKIKHVKNFIHVTIIQCKLKRLYDKLNIKEKKAVDNWMKWTYKIYVECPSCNYRFHTSQKPESKSGYISCKCGKNFKMKNNKLE